MGKSQIFSSLLCLLIFSFTSSLLHLASSTCPMDLSYVQTFPWDTTLCRSHDAGADSRGRCCQSLLSLFGMGLAQHLKDTSLFQLPDANSSSSCLSIFQSQIAALSIDPSLVPQCFSNTAQFVTNTSSCVGIENKQDWIKKIGETTELDQSCRSGDMVQQGLTWCSACLDAGLKVTSQLVASDPKHSTKCFYFTILYAAGIVNEFGPKDERTATCIMGLPLSSSTKPDRESSNGTSNRNNLLKLVFGALGVLVGVLIAIGILFFVYRKRLVKKRQQALHEEFVNGVRARVKPNTGATWFGIAELERATSGFSQRNFIGQGGYGIVYKGTFSDGTVVAVKQILDLDSKGDKEFTNEVELISKIRHRNLLPLRGCCVTSDNSRGRRRYLVYDFMPNGSLHDHLFNSKIKLSWPQRKNIILDVARGLAYLHHGIRPAVYHRDVKATNILLDEEMRGRVGDFGLARQSEEGQSHLTTRAAGTHGYVAPEYALYGQLKEKSDVYSFGIVILETMSGRKVLDAASMMMSSCSTEVLITDWAWKLVKAGRVEEVVEEGMRGEGARGVMERFVLIGILCAHVMVAFRPTIAEALKMLEGDIDIPPLPDRPLPLTLSHEPFRLESLQLPHGVSSSSGISDGWRPSSSGSSFV
ncbi:probable receptor-like protein kinase At1g11050 [Malania oleifera]|uniref:probable receptor-like protein kinase At1g11050 n=1 Tax=Malania oleifera TaxID=397392 RepID=UPI0025AE4E0E|nr:probable receptor-like protein kinase At1g11050 [Malania oleifera]